MMNRKKLWPAVLVLAALCMASCDSKRCVCYTATAGGVVSEDVYTNTDTPCASLSNSNRGCIEEYEVGTIDPGDIAYANGKRAD